jgi:hypothetical protein
MRVGGDRVDLIEAKEALDEEALDDGSLLVG